MAREPQSACEIGIPLAYNDLRPVEPEIISEILKALDVQFGGYTIKGVHEGSWFGQVEQSLRIEIDVDPNRVHVLGKVVYAIGKRLGQKEMYFNVPPPSVRNIVIDNAATGTGGE
ncbi:MAG: hypothetical protein JWN51_3120 [Phycisphaerales bacterium]|nr:hypothetical protein [Phycisphaerales bacterium]